MRVPTIVTAGLVLSVLAACSEEKPGRQPDVSPRVDAGQDASLVSDASATFSPGPVGEAGVPLNATVAQLGDAETMKLCAWNNLLSPQLQPSPQQLCTLMAIGEGTESACQTKLALCTLTAPSPGNQNDCSRVTASGLPGDCTLSIADYEACLLAKVDANRQRFAALSCANAGQVAPPVVEPEACRAWPRECAVLLP